MLFVPKGAGEMIVFIGLSSSIGSKSASGMSLSSVCMWLVCCFKKNTDFSFIICHK